MTPTLTIHNARIILPDRIVDNGSIAIVDDRIVSVEESTIPRGATAIDADGAFVMPGIVDLHNDHLEHEVHPRSNANLPLPFALTNMERRLASSGVTTEFHAVVFEDDADKQRTMTDARSRAAFLLQLEDDAAHGVRHNILHRVDVRMPHSLDHALPTLRQSARPYMSLNDHTPGQGQYRDVARLKSMAESHAPSSSGTNWYRGLLDADHPGEHVIAPFYERISAMRESLGVVVSTHDDDTVRKVDDQHDIGATVAEFPVTFDAAQRARHHGMAIIVGAPNIVRGGSQSGNLSARDLVAHGLADIICADYHAPSLLPAAWMLHQQGLVALPAAVAMITRNPAHAVGMEDRGEIANGKLADLAIIRVDRAGWPHCESTIVGGRHAFHFVRHPDIVRTVPDLPEVTHG